MNVCRGKRNRQGRNDHQQHERTSRRFRSCVFAKTDVGDDRNECGADEMAGAPDRKYFVTTGHELNSPAHYPDADDNEQNTDRYTADFSFAGDQPCAQ